MIDKSTVKSSFSKRADTYDKFASFQKEIANLLLSEIYKRDFSPKNILDIGSGTGNISINLAENYKFSKIITDPSPDNKRAIRCYEKAGFVNQGQIVTPDGDALLMEYELDDKAT